MSHHHPGFLPIPWAQGYSFNPVSQEVISCVRGKCGYRLSIFLCGKQGHQYRVVHATIHGKKTMVYIHDIVAFFHLGPKPSGMHVRHLNGNYLDNSPSNLRYGTRSENMRDAVAHGTNFNTRKTECRNGHAFSAENTIHRKGGGRDCRTCKNARERARYARR